MGRSIQAGQDIIDSRDVIERIEELYGERDAHNDTERDNWSEACPDDAEELTALEALAEEGEQAASEWADGAVLIHDSYFRNYAEELADDLGCVERDRRYTWPFNCIDWERAADELKQDYTSVLFGLDTYYVRS